jgi:hypothetical protein
MVVRAGHYPRGFPGFSRSTSRELRPLNRKTHVPELPAGGHPGLREDVAEMPFDSSRAEKEAAADLTVGQTLLDELGDLAFLIGELC